MKKFIIKVPMSTSEVNTFIHKTAQKDKIKEAVSYYNLIELQQLVEKLETTYTRYKDKDSCWLNEWDLFIHIAKDHIVKLEEIERNSQFIADV